MNAYDFLVPTRVAFGAGRLAELGRLVDGRLTRIMVVTDSGVAHQTLA